MPQDARQTYEHSKSVPEAQTHMMEPIRNSPIKALAMMRLRMIRINKIAALRHDQRKIQNESAGSMMREIEREHVSHAELPEESCNECL